MTWGTHKEHNYNTGRAHTFLPEKGQAVVVAQVVEILQLLPGGGTQALGQAIQVCWTEQHGLVADVDHVLSAGLVLGTDVAEPREGSDSDDVWVGHTGDVGGEASVTASLYVCRD